MSNLTSSFVAEVACADNMKGTVICFIIVCLNSAKFHT